MPIFLFTDFGSADIYVGQVKAVLLGQAPGSTPIDLLHDAPSFRIEEGAHLLAALAPRLPAGSVTIAVVDPGVGSTRSAIAVEADARWFVGPDNGLLSVLASRAGTSRCYELPAVPGASASFHGRDVFAPAAADLAQGRLDALRPKPALDVAFGPADLARVVYIDHYGNAMTGLRAERWRSASELHVAGRTLERARVFSRAPLGGLFWYENSIGLIEIAANQASAASLLALSIGDAVELGTRAH